MITALGGLLVLAGTVSAGRLLLPARRVLPRSLWEECGVAHLLGAAALVALGTLAMLARVDAPSVVLAAAAAALAVDGARVLRARRDPQRRDAPHAAAPWGRAQGVLLAVLGAGAAAVTLALPLNEFDPIYHFGYRAQVLVHHGTALTEAITGMADEDGFGRLVTHPNYPFGVPLLEAAAARVGGWDARWVQVPLAFWAAALPAAVAFGLRAVSVRAAALGALIAACTPMLYVRDFLARGADDLRLAGLGNEMTLGGGADLPLAALLAAAAALLARARAADCRRAGICAGLALAGGALVKNEGLALAAVLVVALVLATLRPPRRLRATIACLGAALVAVAPWLVLRGRLPSIDEDYASRLEPDRIGHFLAGGRELVERSPMAVMQPGTPDVSEAPARLDLVLESFGAEFVDLASWGLLWLLAVLALPWTPRAWRDAERRWIALLLVGGIAAFFLILLVTPWYYPSLRDKGIPERLLLHLVGPAALLVGWRVGNASSES